MSDWKELDMTDKTVIITGANRGIGQETAFQLARRGAKIVLACRNVTEAEQARKEIVTESKNARVFVQKLDLASLESVQAFARDILDNETRLDVLICNAGGLFKDKVITEDGFESTFAVNYLGHFLLVHLLLPLLKKSQQARIIMLSSVSFIFGKIDLENLNAEKGYSFGLTYSNAKLALLLYVKELSARLSGSSVTVNAVHPGIIYTGIVNNMPWLVRGFCSTIRRFTSDVKSGAETSVYLAVSADVVNKSGKLYYWRMEWSECLLFRANDGRVGKELWDHTCKLLNLN